MPRRDAGTAGGWWESEGARQYPEGRGQGWGRGSEERPGAESCPRPAPSRGTHPQSASRCSPWLRGPPGPGPHRLGARAGGSTGSRAAAPAALQRRGCLRSAPLPPPLSSPQPPSPPPPPPPGSPARTRLPAAGEGAARGLAALGTSRPAPDPPPLSQRPSPRCRRALPAAPAPAPRSPAPRPILAGPSLCVAVEDPRMTGMGSGAGSGTPAHLT
jgi:hypothetical protein